MNNGNFSINFTLLAIEAARIGVDINKVFEACPPINEEGSRDMRDMAPILIKAYEARREFLDNRNRTICIVIAIITSLGAVGLVIASGVTMNPRLLVIGILVSLVAVVSLLLRPRKRI